MNISGICFILDKDRNNQPWIDASQLIQWNSTSQKEHSASHQYMKTSRYTKTCWKWLLRLCFVVWLTRNRQYIFMFYSKFQSIKTVFWWSQLLVLFGLFRFFRFETSLIIGRRSTAMPGSQLTQTGLVSCNCL
jgi:hypothetical protein